MGRTLLEGTYPRRLPLPFLARTRTHYTIKSFFCLHCLHRLTQIHEVREMAVKAILHFAFTHKQENINNLEYR